MILGLKSAGGLDNFGIQGGVILRRVTFSGGFWFSEKNSPPAGSLVYI